MYRQGCPSLKNTDFQRKWLRVLPSTMKIDRFPVNETVIVWIADAISGSRPGARYEPHEDYV